ncbi:MAG: Hsp70 family protein, partial [Synergistaceae bacterium]|nr:Hsp70 family protein [Synergistaceae bacterium]
EKIEKRYFNGAALTTDPNIFCVIGCPAEWNDPQKRKVEDIARQAGFPNVTHCEEPLGVIYYYHFRGDLDLSEDRNVLVYDFGGGTTDVAIEKVRTANGGAVGVDVLAANGIANLGGMVFDRALADFFINKLGLDPQTLPLRDRQQIERYSRILKEDLSRRVEEGHNSAEVSIPMLRATKSGCTLSITRDEFNSVCAEFIEQFDEPIYEALNFSTLMQDKIDRVILAGGSSALPYVRDKIAAIFPSGSILTSASPTEVIAKGLAVYGRVTEAAKKAVSPVQPERQEEKPIASVQTVPLKKEQPAARRPETRPEEPQRPASPKPKETGGNKKIWLTVAVIALAVAGGFGYMQNNAAQKQTALQAQLEQERIARKEAEKAQREADERAKQEETARKEAEKAQREADERAKQEETARKEAEKAQREADERAKQEETARKEAEKAQREADQRAKQEETARKEAERKEQAREKAENERLAREKAEQRAAKLNSTYTSGKFLGRSFTAEQSASIRAGTFDGMELGDYWRIDDVIWRIADFDYLIRSGKVDKSKHHVMIVPDSSLYSARMNSTNSISTIRGVGYIASEMYRSGLNRARQIIEGAFGKGHILPDYGIELMTKAMVFGKGDIAFSLFQLRSDYRTANKSGEYYWLQDASSYSRFSVVGDYSNWTSHSDLPAAYDSGGVRPAFAIY